VAGWARLFYYKRLGLGWGGGQGEFFSEDSTLTLTFSLKKEGTPALPRDNPLSRARERVRVRALVSEENVGFGKVFHPILTFSFEGEGILFFTR